MPCNLGSFENPRLFEKYQTLPEESSRVYGSKIGFGDWGLESLGVPTWEASVYHFMDDLSFKCDMSHMCIGHINMHESCDAYNRVTPSQVLWRHPYECVSWHIWIRHVTHVNESRHKYAWVMSRICSCGKYERSFCATHVNESRHTFESIMSHMWMGHVTNMHGSCHAYDHVWGDYN